jgi:hypothetical protein
MASRCGFQEHHSNTELHKSNSKRTKVMQSPYLLPQTIELLGEIFGKR